MESFAFPNEIKLTSTEIPQCRKQACFFNVWLPTGVNFFAQILSLATNPLSLAENSISLAKKSLFLIKKIVENLKFV